MNKNIGTSLKMILCVTGLLRRQAADIQTQMHTRAYAQQSVEKVPTFLHINLKQLELFQTTYLAKNLT